MTSRSGPIAFSSPPDVVPMLAGVPIAGGHQTACIAATSGGSWICRRTVARFRCGLNNPATRARARERLIIVEFRGFRRARSPQGMLCECSDSAHRLHSKKPLPWRVTGASVARHVERPWVRSKNVYIAEPAPELQRMCCEIGAPRREIGVELDFYPRDPP